MFVVSEWALPFQSLVDDLVLESLALVQTQVEVRPWEIHGPLALGLAHAFLVVGIRGRVANQAVEETWACCDQGPSCLASSSPVQGNHSVQVAYFPNPYLEVWSSPAEGLWAASVM